MRVYSILLAFALAMAALAADATGKWSYETQGRRGPQTVTLNLKQDGEALTGSMAGGRGGDIQISNGKVNGDTVSFEVVREFQGNSFTTKYTGKISGSSMELTIEGPRGGPQTVTAKKE